LIDYGTYENYFGGEVSATIESTEDLEGSLTSDTTEVRTTTVCFDAVENSETGRRLVGQEENTCVNNFCVLKQREGGIDTAAYGTSVNLNISGDNSILSLFGVGQSEHDEFCVEEIAAADSEQGFIDCGSNIWYAPEYGALIYGEVDLSGSSGIVSSIIDWFFSLFGADEEVEELLESINDGSNKFVAEGSGVKIFAGVSEENGTEVFAGQYQWGGDVDFCSFIENAPYENVFKDQWPADPEVLAECNVTEDFVYSILTKGDSNGYWWQQLTAATQNPDVHGDRE